VNIQVVFLAAQWNEVLFYSSARGRSTDLTLWVS